MYLYHLYKVDISTLLETRCTASTTLCLPNLSPVPANSHQCSQPEIKWECSFCFTSSVKIPLELHVFTEGLCKANWLRSLTLLWTIPYREASPTTFCKYQLWIWFCTDTAKVTHHAIVISVAVKTSCQFDTEFTTPTLCFLFLHCIFSLWPWDWIQVYSTLSVCSVVDALASYPGWKKNKWPGIHCMCYNAHSPFPQNLHGKPGYFGKLS